MLKRITAPSRLEGEASLPGDKSISHRALMFNALAEGTAEVNNLCPGKDALATVSCLRSLGVNVRRKGDRATIPGAGKAGLREPEDVLDARNSGTTTRLLTGLLAAQPFLSVITGDASLRSRPMKRVIEPLRLMGGEIFGRGGDSYAPLVIRGRPLHGITYPLPVASAQVKSAILLAGLFASGETTVVEPLRSRDHSERMLARMGVKLAVRGKEVTLRPPASGGLQPLSIDVPGDISAAAYFLVAGAIHPDARITVRDCGVNPTRTGLLSALKKMGARLQVANERDAGGEPVADLTIQSSRLTAIEVAGEDIPEMIDEIPVLALAACFARGRTVIHGAGELRVKESDRIRTITTELARMGARIQELPDGMVIDGDAGLHGAEVDSHLDHRLAMTLAVAGLVARGETVISNAGAASISHPGFWEELERLSQE